MFRRRGAKALSVKRQFRMHGSRATAPPARSSLATLAVAMRTCLALIACVVVVGACGGEPTPSTTPGPHVAAVLPGTDQSIRAIAVSADGQTAYLGGDFTKIGLPLGSVARFDRATGRVIDRGIDVDGPIHAMVSDGSNGWYIGGTFTRVGTEARNNVARVLASGRVDPQFNPDVSGPVYALATGHGVVYAGGDFGQIGGQSRSYLGAVDATTGAPSAWNPSANYIVRALAVAGNTVFVGGEFTEFARLHARRRIAAIDAASGLPTAWNPGPAFGDPGDGIVRQIAIAGTRIFVSGDFGTMGGQARRSLAAIDANSGLATAWNANLGAGSLVMNIALGSTALYASGTFSITVAGRPRTNAAAFDLATGAPTAWDPRPVDATGEASFVGPMIAQGADVYVAGSFAGAGGRPRDLLAALDQVTGDASGWAPSVAPSRSARSGPVVLGLTASELVVSGNIPLADVIARQGLAAIDITTGVLTPWNPNPDGAVSAIAVSGSAIVVGGGFATIGGESRRGIAAVDAQSGRVTAWSANVNGAVRTLALSGDTLYVADSPLGSAESPRIRIVAIDSRSGATLPWAVDPVGYVNSIVATASAVHVVGGPTVFGECACPRGGISIGFDTGPGARVLYRDESREPLHSLAVVGGKVFASEVDAGVSPPYPLLRWRDLTNGATGGASPSIRPGVLAALRDQLIVGPELQMIDPRTVQVTPPGGVLVGARASPLATWGDRAFLAGTLRSMDGRPRGDFHVVTP